jgi:hypothetical protein
MVGYRFNTIGVSDGISMGTDGMSFSLQSRDLIADSIETVMSAQVREVGSENRGLLSAGDASAASVSASAAAAAANHWQQSMRLTCRTQSLADPLPLTACCLISSDISPPTTPFPHPHKLHTAFDPASVLGTSLFPMAHVGVG